jgi:hypothetical protein
LATSQYDRCTLVHQIEFEENGIDDPESIQLARDAWTVSCSVFQGMPVVGRWLELRVASLVRSWLPDWCVSSGQVFDPARPDVRSRSWDLIVHRDTAGLSGLPPEACPGSGPPLVPKGLCCAVIDTKNNFSDVAQYARMTVFNLMNDATAPQLEFLCVHEQPFACNRRSKGSGIRDQRVRPCSLLRWPRSTESQTSMAATARSRRGSPTSALAAGTAAGRCRLEA